MPTATYDRPVQAKLIVRLENDEEWEASDEDVLRFGYVASSGFSGGMQPEAIYEQLVQVLRRALTDKDIIANGDMSQIRLNPVLQLFQRALMAPETLNAPDHEQLVSMVCWLESNLQRILTPALQPAAQGAEPA